MTRSWVPKASSDVSIVRMDSELVREIYTLKSLVYLTWMSRIFEIGLSGRATMSGTSIVAVVYPCTITTVDSKGLFLE